MYLSLVFALLEQSTKNISRSVGTYGQKLWRKKWHHTEYHSRWALVNSFSRPKAPSKRQKTNERSEKYLIQKSSFETVKETSCNMQNKKNATLEKYVLCILQRLYESMLGVRETKEKVYRFKQKRNSGSMIRVSMKPTKIQFSGNVLQTTIQRMFAVSSKNF